MNCICSIAIGLVVGYITARVLKVEPWFRKSFMCIIATGQHLTPTSHTQTKSRSHYLPAQPLSMKACVVRFRKRKDHSDGRPVKTKSGFIQQLQAGFCRECTEFADCACPEPLPHWRVGVHSGSTRSSMRGDGHCLCRLLHVGCKHLSVLRGHQSHAERGC